MALGTNNPEQILVGSNGAVFTAPVGTTLPTAYDSALNGFDSVGYISEAGPKLSNGKTVSDIRAWQSFNPIASRVKETSLTISFELMEWDYNTVPLAFGGGTITEPTPDHFKFTPADPSVIDERSLVLDVHDGDDVWRFVFPRGYAAENLEANFTRDNAALLPVGFKVLAPTDGGRDFFIYTNAEQFDSASTSS